MAIIIKGNVHGDVIGDGGVKNETHYHYDQKTNNTANVVSNTQQVVNVALNATRQSILDQLQDYADKGDWVNGITSENVKAMLKAVLGVDENLSAQEAELSETLWRLLESGRGDRVKIVWQNMVLLTADFEHIIPLLDAYCPEK